MKGKLVMSIYKPTKPSSLAPYNSKVKSSPLPPAVGGGFIAKQDQAKQKVPRHPHHVEFIVNQDQVVPQQNQKVSFQLPADGGGRDSYGTIHDNLYCVAVDESVDLKATIYISAVRDKLGGLHPRINPEQKKLQDVQH